MSFIGSVKGQTYTPGWFLVNNDGVTLETRQIAQSGAETAPSGGKVVRMGTVYPANGATAEGIVFEDVDVTSGDMPGSVVTRGTIYLDRLPTAPVDAAKTALTAKGFVLIDAAPTVTRPY